jgi:hypothetical protein
MASANGMGTRLRVTVRVWGVALFIIPRKGWGRARGRCRRLAVCLKARAGLRITVQGGRSEASGCDGCTPQASLKSPGMPEPRGALPGTRTIMSTSPLLRLHVLPTVARAATDCIPHHTCQSWAWNRLERARGQVMVSISLHHDTLRVHPHHHLIIRG